MRFWKAFRSVRSRERKTKQTDGRIAPAVRDGHDDAPLRDWQAGSLVFSRGNGSDARLTALVPDLRTKQAQLQSERDSRIEPVNVILPDGKVVRDGRSRAIA